MMVYRLLGKNGHKITYIEHFACKIKAEQTKEALEIMDTGSKFELREGVI